MIEIWKCDWFLAKQQNMVKESGWVRHSWKERPTMLNIEKGRISVRVKKPRHSKIPDKQIGRSRHFPQKIDNWTQGIDITKRRRKL